jgi:hypothetical protein
MRGLMCGWRGHWSRLRHALAGNPRCVRGFDITPTSIPPALQSIVLFTSITPDSGGPRCLSWPTSDSIDVGFADRECAVRWRFFLCFYKHIVSITGAAKSVISMGCEYEAYFVSSFEAALRGRAFFPRESLYEGSCGVAASNFPNSEVGSRLPSSTSTRSLTSISDSKRRNLHTLEMPIANL